MSRLGYTYQGASAPSGRSDTRFVVMTATARMPSTVKARYRRVAVVEIEPGATPRMISTHARGVVAIVETWERLSVGRTDRCAFARAMREASALCARLDLDRRRYSGPESIVLADMLRERSEPAIEVES
jgi:hypothetical protein